MKVIREVCLPALITYERRQSKPPDLQPCLPALRHDDPALNVEMINEGLCELALLPGKHYTLVLTAVFSTLIGREVHSVAPPALLCHKEPIQSPLLGASERPYAGSLWHKG